MKLTFKRHQKQMTGMRNRLAELEAQLVMLRKEKQLAERESEVKELIADLHPTKKQAAIKKIKSVLGDFSEFGPAARKEIKKELPGLRKDWAKFKKWHAKRKAERERMFEKQYGGSRNGKEPKMKHFFEK